MPYTSGLTNIFDAALPAGRVALDAGNDETLLLRITTGADYESAASYAVVRSEWEKPEVAGGPLKFTTRSLRIEVSFAPFSLRIEDADGNVRFATCGKGLEFDGAQIRLTRALGENESVYGLGEHGEILDRNPGVYRFWNRDEPVQHAFKQFYCGIPFGVSHPGGAELPHGFFLDNPGELLFNVGRDNPAELRMETRNGDLRLWLLFEPSPAEIVEQYTALTGRMERPPMWALGYHQCRWSYPNEKKVREIAHGFRTRSIPCDAIWLDIDYMEQYRVFTWSAANFPDPKGLLADLRAEGFSTVTIVDPGVAIAKGYHAYDEGKEIAGFFVRHLGGDLIVERVWPGETHLPDFTNPATRKKWGEWQGAALLDAGIDGIWNDMNEPAVFAVKEPTRDFPGDGIHHDNGSFRNHARVHNVYGLTMAQASTEGQLAHRPGVRPFALTRSGWAGIQRHAAVWTGDNRSAFTCMPQDLMLVLNLGMSGVAFSGCDIGGFCDHATPELMARWMEWGVLQPFCRGHAACWSVDQEPWSFGPATERVIRRMIELRYRLLPYLYTQFVEAAETGMPVMRPLVLDYPNDATVARIGDEFLVGPDILCAPVLDAGKDHRAVYLPAGDWVHWWSGEAHLGGKWHLAGAPIGRPPIYVRAGAAIPAWPAVQHTKEARTESVVEVWPAARIAGRMVEDDGVSREYLSGAECRVIFSGESDGRRVRLLIGAPQGPWRSPRTHWTVRIHTQRRAAEVRLGGKPIAFEQEGGIVSATFADDRRAKELEALLDG